MGESIPRAVSIRNISHEITNKGPEDNHSSVGNLALTRYTFPGPSQAQITDNVW
jgi:hypothetical protein